MHFVVTVVAVTAIAVASVDPVILVGNATTADEITASYTPAFLLAQLKQRKQSGKGTHSIGTKQPTRLKRRPTKQGKKM